MWTNGKEMEIEEQRVDANIPSRNFKSLCILEERNTEARNNDLNIRNESDTNSEPSFYFFFTSLNSQHYRGFIYNWGPFHFLASAAAGAGLGCPGARGGSPPSMQLPHFLSTSWPPPEWRRRHARTRTPASTPTIVITARTTSNVSIDLRVDWVDWWSWPATANGGGCTICGSIGPIPVCFPNCSMARARAKPQTDLGVDSKRKLYGAK